MHTLPLNFTILQLCGVWRPLMWPTGWKSGLYNCYTIMMIFFYNVFIISQCIDLFVLYESFEKFVSDTFLILTSIGTNGKMIIFVQKRKEIIDLTNVLRNDLWKPRNTEEMQILIDCERNARRNVSWYSALCTATAFAIMLRSLVLDLPERNLVYNCWLPYHFDSLKIGFWFAYLHQIHSVYVTAAIAGSFDTIVAGFMMQPCAQMEILKYRIKSIPRAIEARRKSFGDKNDENYQRESQTMEFELLRECIRHHNEIFQFADNLNDIFGIVVLLQFAISSLVICVSIYKISSGKFFSYESVHLVMYLMCVLLQIFFFCAYGGELTLQSSDLCDAIYEMDWSSLCIRTKKVLMMMMTRSLRPITFTCGNVIILSLDSFKSVLKISYSVYNVLQQ